MDLQREELILVLLHCISTGKLKFSSVTNVFMKIRKWKNLLLLESLLRKTNLY